MGSRWRSFQPKRLTPAAQRAFIANTWPSLATRVVGDALHAQGELQPSPVTRPYRVRLVYSYGRNPVVHVLSPRLERRPSEPDVPIPHTYNFAKPGEERPCVYDPFKSDWTPAMPIAKTIIPWVLAWLVDYEIWIATGLWLGGGRAHEPIAKRDDNA